MNDLESTISSILADPDAMKQIRQLGKSLGLDSTEENSTANNKPERNHKTDNFDLSSVASLFSGIQNKSSSPDSELLASLTRFLPLIKGMNKEDESTALLKALKPFLSGEKRRKLDEAGKLLRLFRLLPIIKSQGLL